MRAPPPKAEPKQPNSAAKHTIVVIMGSEKAERGVVSCPPETNPQCSRIKPWINPRSQKGLVVSTSRPVGPYIKGPSVLPFHFIVRQGLFWKEWAKTMVETDKVVASQNDNWMIYIQYSIQQLCRFEYSSLIVVVILRKT
jgi:hypothetical protein